MCDCSLRLAVSCRFIWRSSHHSSCCYPNAPPGRTMSCVKGGITALTLYAGLYVGCDPQLRLAVLAGAKLLECPQSPVTRMPERLICTLALLSASRWRECRHGKVAWSYRPGGSDERRLGIGSAAAAQRAHRAASCSRH